MPPRKKPRVGASTTSTPAPDVQTPAAATPAAQDTPSQPPVSTTEMVLDPWTDEQETALFKGVIRWKPAGMHKHFRMMSIAQQLRDQGHMASRDRHTRIPGIWRKLGTLYNLGAVDEREDSFLEPDEEMDDARDQPYHAFALPDADYGEERFSRRLAPDGSASPPQLDPRGPASKVRRGRRTERSISRVGRGSTVDDTEEEVRSSPAAPPSTRGARSKRGAAATPRIRGKFRGRLSGSRGATEEETTGRDDDDDAEEDEDDEEDDDDEDEDGSTTAGCTTAGSPPVKSARGGASLRGRGRGRRGRRGRGGSDRRRSGRKK